MASEQIPGHRARAVRVDMAEVRGSDTRIGQGAAHARERA